MTDITKAKIAKVFRTGKLELVQSTIILSLAITFLPLYVYFFFLPKFKPDPPLPVRHHLRAPKENRDTYVVLVTILMSIFWIISTLLYSIKFSLGVSLLLTSATLLSLCLVLFFVLLVFTRADDINLTQAEIRAYKLKHIL